jgi:hypothetical protein
MTLRDKTLEVRQLALNLALIVPKESADYATIRQQAMALKRKLQNLASSARAAELRSCEHVPAEQGHTYTEVRPTGRRRVTYYRCAKCGKAAVKQIDVTETEQELA